MKHSHIVVDSLIRLTGSTLIIFWCLILRFFAQAYITIWQNQCHFIANHLIFLLLALVRVCVWFHLWHITSSLSFHQIASTSLPIFKLLFKLFLLSPLLNDRHSMEVCFFSFPILLLKYVLMSKKIPQTDGAMPKIDCCYCLFINFWMTSAVSFIHESVLIRFPTFLCVGLKHQKLWSFCSDFSFMEKWFLKKTWVGVGWLIVGDVFYNM